MRLKNKKVLVTGAGGFIGSHLCEALLDAGAELTAMIRYASHPRWGNLEFLSKEKKDFLRVVAGNIEDPDFVATHVKGKDCVFHLAALIAIPYSFIAPRSYVRSNIEGTLNVLESARAFEVEKVVHTSTSETYGTAIYTPIDEAHPLQGQSPYSASKIGADKLVESYCLSFNLPVATIRPFNTFGPRQSARAIIPTIIAQAFVCDEVRLGSIAPVRDFTYVKDLAQAFISMAETDQTIGQTVNIGSGRGITIGNLAETILGLMKRKHPVVVDKTRLRPEKSEVFNLVCDNNKAKQMLGWSPAHSLEQGLSDTVEFISKNLDLYKPGIYAL